MSERSLFDRITGYGLRGYGIGTILLGFAVVFAGGTIDSIDILTVGAMGIVLGLAMVHLSLDRWYCQMCGQAQGRLLKPSTCDRCDSNRMAKRDPGVGDAVRVKR